MLQDPKFWVAVATLTFVALVFRPVKKMAIAALDARISKVRTELDDARRLREEAEKILLEAQDKLAKSEDSVKKIIEHAQIEAESLIKNANNKLQKDIEIRKNLAMSKIQSLEESAIDDIKKNISALTILAAHTILEENIDEETGKRLDHDSIEKIIKTYH